MATHHARSVLAALAIGAALTTAGCTAEPASSSNSPASAERPGSDSGADDSSGSSDSSESTEAKGSEDQNGSGDSGSKAKPRWCTTDALSVSLRPEQPAAGSRYASLLLTNSSGTACRTRGWPGLQLMGADGEKIPTEVVRDESEPSRPLTLAAGERSSARLHWTIVPSQGDPADGKCPEPGSVRVIPPDQRTAKSAVWKLGEVCGTGEIDVLPLQIDKGAGRP
jgi:hypothetical protein